jgi:hypothetical protein
MRPLDQETEDDERPSANGHRPPEQRVYFEPPRAVTILLGVMWLFCMGYGIWQGDPLAIVIALVFALFIGAPALIVFGFGRRSGRNG